MIKGVPFGLVRKFKSRFMRTDPLSERVRRTLVRTLYTQPSSLIIGAFNGIVSSGVVAYSSGQFWLSVTWGILCVVAIGRILSARSFSTESEEQITSRMEISYELGAFSYALIL